MPNFFSNDQLAALQANYQPIEFGQPTNKKKTQGRGGSATSFISEAGGAGGALGGAAIGTAILPGVGTVIGAGLGGLLGGFGGRAAENKIRDDEFRLGDAAKEGVLSGVLGAGPGQLLKVAKPLVGAGTRTAEKGLAGALAETAQGGASNLVSQAAEVPLKTSVRGRVEDLSSKLLSNQYGTISKPVARKTDPLKTIGTLADNGLTKIKDVDRVSTAISGSDGVINRAVVKAVGDAGQVSTKNVPFVLDNAIKGAGLVDSEAKAVQGIVNGQLNSIGTEVAKPGDVLKVMKNIEAEIAELTGKGGNYHIPTTADKRQAKALTAARDELRENLYGAAGANKNLANVLTPDVRKELISLKPNNAQWQKFVDDKVLKAKTIGELRSTMAPFVRARQIIDEGDVNFITAGGRLGNMVAPGGGLASQIAGFAANALKNPTSRAAGSALRTVSNLDAAGLPLAGTGAKNIAKRVGIVGGLGEAAGASYGAIKAGRPAFAAGATETLPEQQPGLTGALQDSAQFGADPMAAQDAGMQQPMSASPYPRENLMADIQRDPQNASKYLAYYKDLEEVFNPQGEEQSLNATSRASLAASSNGIGTLDQLQQLFAQAGNGSGKVGGFFSNLGAKAGANGDVQTYNDLAASSVSQLAKALNGGGQVSDTDAAVVIQALPKVTDSPEVARRKFAALKQRLDNARQNTLLYGGGAETSTQGAQ